ncbi:MAG TPA: glycoside hydrolase family 2 TIM barrel-domain containing protein, partial [Opitutaceae bacterium]
GRCLGRHDSGFTAFAFDVTAALKPPGEVNRLAVRVRQQDKFWKMDQNDDWSLPGIYRSVWLEFLPKPFHLDRIEVTTDFDEDYRDAELRVRALVARYEKGHPWLSVSDPVEVRAVLSDRSGTEVQRAAQTVRITGARTARDVPLTLRVTAPARWTAETPTLYELRVELAVGGRVVHTRTERVGFREIATAGGVLRLNGREIKLRGVGRHDLNPEVGRATRPQDWLADLRAMKAANINTVRTAHYPPAEGFLRLCDELGMYVVDEVPFCLADEELADPSFAGEALNRVRETVARDRNRPSVIIWALGNEDPLTDIHITCARALKGMDPTRPLLLPWRAEADLPPEIDLLAPHYWTAEEYDRLAAAARRPILSTEYTHAVGRDDFGGLADRWTSLTRHPAGAGALIWAWADQGLRRPVNGRPVYDPVRDLARYPARGSDLVLSRRLGSNEILDVHGVYGGDGIVDADLTPQRDYWETKAVYSPVQVLADRVAFAPGQAEVSIPVRNAYDFTDLATVRATWILYRNQTKLAEGVAPLAGAPHAETALIVPATAVPADAPPGAYFLHLAFADPAGAEITRRSVRLGDLPTRPAAP